MNILTQEYGKILNNQKRDPIMFQKLVRGIDNLAITTLGTKHGEQLTTDTNLHTKWVNSKWWVKRALAADSPLLTTTQTDSLLEEGNITILTRLAWNKNITSQQAEQLAGWVKQTNNNEQAGWEKEAAAQTIAYALANTQTDKLKPETMQLFRKMGVTL